MRHIALALVIPAVLMAGCGSSGNSSSSSASSSTPQPTQSLNQFAASWAKTAQSPSCSKSALAQFAEGVSWSCSTQSRQARNFKVLKTAQYGTGAVIDWSDAGFRAGTWVLGLGSGGKWKVMFAPAILGGTVGTHAPKSTLPKFDNSIESVFTAVRAKNCDLFFRNALTNAPKATACRNAFNNVVAKGIASDRSSTPTRLGGNGVFQFYSAKVKPNHYITQAVGREPSSGKYITVGPVPYR